jgi:energy-coupling factor transport system ATP-binding protein
MISLRDFSYRYRGSDRYALQDVNLDINEGEFVLLTGPSGCGKSTLALAIAGFLFSQYDGEISGQVDVNGMDPSREPIYQISDVVGLVQQNPEDQFCTLMVEDEIVFGLENRKLPSERIEELLTWSLDAVGAEHLRERPLSTLSGGEKQRIALAAILAAQPRVIVFDEPTSNLDPPATQEIFEIILGLQQKTNLTVLVIEHKLDFLGQAKPRLIEMGMGTILEQQSDRRYNGDLEILPPIYSVLPPSPLFEVEGLSAVYEEKTVLSGVSFKLGKGELVSLMGDNGSGKSTLLLSLMGLVERSQGSINFQGKPLEDTKLSVLGKDIGLVFQNPDHQLFASSVWEEAILGAQNFKLDPRDYESHTRSLLHRAGLTDREADHPYRLSYGEKRRLNLISVLSYQPAVLLLDEIFIGQDRDNAGFLLDLLCEYVEQGGSVIMVNHNPSYYPQVSTRVLFLSGGTLEIDEPLVEGLAALKKMGKEAYLPGGGV